MSKFQINLPKTAFSMKANLSTKRARNFKILGRNKPISRT